MTTTQGTLTFQDGLGGYLGTMDTMVSQSSPSTIYTFRPTLSVDGSSPSGSGNDLQALLRFRNIIGDGVSQIPEGARVISATLTLHAIDPSQDGVQLHQMLRSWQSDTASWNSLVGGISPNGVEAAAIPSIRTGAIGTGSYSFNVTSDVQAWVNGAANNGWAILPQGNDGWDFYSKQGTVPPKLTVTYAYDDEPSGSFDVTVDPTLETARVAGTGDVADDPAILLHPTDLSRSVVLGTDKALDGNGGLYVFGLDGSVIDTAGVGRSYNNTDVAYRFELGGRDIALIGASVVTGDDLRFYSYDFAARDLKLIGVVDGPEGVYGFELGYVDGKHYAYVSTKSGYLYQYELDGSSGQVTGRLVRTIDVGTTAEGMVVDEESGRLYVGEEDVGIWRYDASANGGSTRTSLDNVNGHLTAEVEGLAIYHQAGGSGFILASAQGADTFQVYDTATGAWLGELQVAGVTDTDGIDVTNANLGGAFTEGLFVVHDMSNSISSNFKLVSWGDIANASGLPVDTSYDVRADPYL